MEKQKLIDALKKIAAMRKREPDWMARREAACDTGNFDDTYDMGFDDGEASAAIAAADIADEALKSVSE